MVDLASIAAEAWAWTAPPNAYVLAFQVGRLSNCLHWATSRAAMWPKAETLGAVEAIFDRLAELAHNVDGAGGEGGGLESLAANVARARDGFTAAIEGEAHGHWCEQVADAPDAWWPQAWDWSPVVRGAFAARLDSAGRAALRLGWHVDRGLRPMPAEGADLSAAERLRLRHLIAESQSPPERLTGGPLWLGDVRGLCAALGIDASLPAANHVHERVAAVYQHIWDGLNQLWAAREAAMAAALAEAGPSIVAADVTPAAGDAPGPGEDAQSPAPTPPMGSPSCAHSSDFTSVTWYGTPYTFRKGQEADCVRLLWGNWEKGLTSLSQGTIAQDIGASDTYFELSKVFRRRRKNGLRGYDTNPAWGTMIGQVTKGCYALRAPAETGT